MELLQTIFTSVGIIVSASSVIVAGLDKIAGLTPTDKDDKALAAAARGLAAISYALDKVSVYQRLKK